MKGRDTMYNIITISRQCGSGGHSIGEELSKKLGIPLYDREIIEMTAKESGLTNEFIEESNEKITNSVLFNIANSMTYATQVFNGGTVSLVDEVFFIQCKVIKDLASRGPCIFVGRCADYVLKERDDVLNVFIQADKPYRVERFSQEYGCTAKEAEVAIKKRDKGRQNYHKYYSDREWGKSENYDMVMNSKKIGIEGCAKIIADIVNDSKK